jgi:phosphonate transport system substrate-binding protein
VSRKILIGYMLLLVFISSIEAKERCLRYGVIPYSNISDIEKSYIKWQEYLSQKIKRCIEISFESSYGNVINKFSQNELDMAFVGPFSYVLIKQIIDVEPIVTGVTSDGFATYRSYLVVTPKVQKMLNIHKRLQGKSGMKILKQKLSLYKKKWMIAFTDEGSTSGYAIPSYYMKKVGIDFKEYFKKITFVGSHDAAQLVVYNDIIPMAFSAQMLYEKLLKNNKITKEQNRVIWQSDKIPKSPIIIRSSISNELKSTIKQALLDIPKEDIPKIAKEIKYVATNEKNYKIIEDVNKYLKK